MRGQEIGILRTAQPNYSERVSRNLMTLGELCAGRVKSRKPVRDLPTEGCVSAACRRGEHGNNTCTMLACGCECHREKETK